MTQGWDKTLTEQLLNRANSCYHTQINDLLLTALVLALCEWQREVTGQSEDGKQAIRFDVEGHGREDGVTGLDSGETVGWFTSLYRSV